jgi:hypothetical protein
MDAVPKFPITKSQSNSFEHGSGGLMDTTVTIAASGALTAATRTREVTALHGFEGAVAVAVTNQNLDLLWVSPTQRFGVDGRDIGRSDRTDDWNAQIPPAILPQIRKVAIIQRWNPKNVFDDIQAWLKGLTTVASDINSLVNQIKPIAQDVEAVVAVL